MSKGKYSTSEIWWQKFSKRGFVNAPVLRAHFIEWGLFLSCKGRCGATGFTWKEKTIGHKIHLHSTILQEIRPISESVIIH